MVEQLVRCGANIRAKDGLAGMSALHLAVYSGHRELARYLALQDPGCLEQRTMAGITAYRMACSYDVGIAEDLRALGACTDFSSEEDEPMSGSEDEFDTEGESMEVG